MIMETEASILSAEFASSIEKTLCRKIVQHRHQVVTKA